MMTNSETSAFTSKNSKFNLKRKNITSILAVFTFFAMVSWSQAQENLLSPESWTVGTGHIAGFAYYGNTSENERISGTNPFGNQEVLWVSDPDGGGGTDGGFFSPWLNIDATKTYRFTLWLKKTGSNTGTSYFGLYTQNSSSQTVTLKSNGQVNTNPYFWTGDLPQLNKWYMVVGYLHPDSYSGSSQGKMYDGTTFQEVSSVNFNDYRFGVGATKMMLRSVLFGDTTSSNFQYYWRPTIHEVDLTNPTLEAQKIQELLGQNVSDTVDPTISSFNATVDNSAVNFTWSDSDNVGIISRKISYNGIDHIPTQTTSTTISNLAAGSYSFIMHVEDAAGNSTTSTISATIVDDSGTGTEADHWIKTNSDIHYASGNVGIGTNAIPNYRLAVDGKIRTREVLVDTNTNWPDYVFFNNYKLPTLQEVEKHIQEKGHLINIPSAEEVEANGIELGKMNTLLLEKIEELTLYILQQEKAQKQLEERLKTLEGKK